jgi:hypothetical protein
VTVQAIFKTCTLSTDGVIYSYIQLPAKAIMAAAGVLAEFGEAFAALIVDQHEVSLMLPAEAYQDFSQRLPLAQTEGTWRLISFDCVLPFDVVGFMALVSQLLAQAQIPLLAFAAYSRDHFFVPTDQFERAWSALIQAQQLNTTGE